MLEINATNTFTSLTKGKSPENFLTMGSDDVDAQHIGTYTVKIPTFNSNIVGNTPLAKENKEDIDETLLLIKECCTKFDLRVGQLFENLKFISVEKDLFSYSNNRLNESLKNFLKD
jgi:hypothetical protein